jgi:hypothetical protein
LQPHSLEEEEIEEPSLISNRNDFVSVLRTESPKPNEAGAREADFIALPVLRILQRNRRSRDSDQLVGRRL